MSAFFMRLSQKDYSFIMKCLNWCITHDDGVDDILFDMPDQVKALDENMNEKKVAFYLNLNIECLSLFVVTRK